MRWKAPQIGLGLREVPRAATAAGGIARQPLSHPQFQQRCSATARCLSLPPQSRPESHPDPAVKANQHFRCFAESEIAAPAPHVRSQFLHRRLHADTFCPSRDLPDSPPKPIQGLRCNNPPDLRTSSKAEPEKLPFLRSCHRTLPLIYLEFELLRDESRNAFHHPLPRPLAAHVDITVVRVANETMAPALQLPVEFVEHEVTEQWRKWTSLRSPFHARADQPVLHHPGIQECPDELQQPLVLDPLGDLAHQFVVVDSIEEFLQIKINAPAVTFGDILLRLFHRLLGLPARPEPVAVIGKRPVPPPLQNLHHRLLDESIQHRWNAKLSHPSVRLGDFYPPHRFRLVSSTQQLFPDGWPVLFQVILDSDDGHPVNTRTTLIGLHPPQCCLQVFSLAYFLHQSFRASWVFGPIHRPGRFSLFPSRLSGFTRRLRREVQLHLDLLLLVVLEIHGLLASPSRSGLQPPFPAWPIRCSAFRHAECLTSLADVMT